MARKSAPFTMRLPPATDRFVTEEAQRTNRSKGAVVQALAEEALRSRLFPGIAFRGEDWERRPWILGSALDVWQVVDAFREFGSIERLVAETDLTERQVRLALAYYERFPHEIDAAIEENRAPLEGLLARFPTIDSSPISR